MSNVKAVRVLLGERVSVKWLTHLFGYLRGDGVTVGRERNLVGRAEPPPIPRYVIIYILVNLWFSDRNLRPHSLSR